MNLPLLITKICPPQPRRLAVPRPVLAARLDAGLDCKLTVISEYDIMAADFEYYPSNTETGDSFTEIYIPIKVKHPQAIA